MSNLLKQALEARKALTAIEDTHYAVSSIVLNFITAVEQHIEQAEQAKPVYQYRVVGGGWKDCSRTLYEQFSKDPITTRVLYTHPQLSKPLSRAQKAQMWLAATIELPSHENCYLRGIADAERAHGIKEQS